jgi:hypothetical protein
MLEAGFEAMTKALSFLVLWSPKFISITGIFTNSANVSQKTKHVSITSTDLSLLFREIIAVFYDYHEKHIIYTMWAKYKVS